MPWRLAIAKEQGLSPDHFAIAREQGPALQGHFWYCVLLGMVHYCISGLAWIVAVSRHINTRTYAHTHTHTHIHTRAHTHRQGKRGACISLIFAAFLRHLTQLLFSTVSLSCHSQHTSCDPSIPAFLIPPRPIFTHGSHGRIGRSGSRGGRGRLVLPYIHLLGFLRGKRDGEVFSHDTYFCLAVHTDHVLVIDMDRVGG